MTEELYISDQTPMDGTMEAIVEQETSHEPAEPEGITPDVENTANAENFDIKTDADISSETSTMEETAEDTESLKAEISKLREEIRRKESEQIKMAQEIADFNRLFPNVPISGLPEDVINNMNKGIPLTAAYALYEKEAALLANKAHEVNTRNASLSAGRAGTETKGEFFTPDEVRTMSQKEVHENYKKIRNSMTQWRKAY